MRRRIRCFSAGANSGDQRLVRAWGCRGLEAVGVWRSRQPARVGVSGAAGRSRSSPRPPACGRPAELTRPGRSGPGDPVPAVLRVCPSQGGCPEVTLAGKRNSLGLGDLAPVGMCLLPVRGLLRKLLSCSCRWPSSQFKGEIAGMVAQGGRGRRISGFQASLFYIREFWASQSNTVRPCVSLNNHTGLPKNLVSLTLSSLHLPTFVHPYCLLYSSGFLLSASRAQRMERH